MTKDDNIMKDNFDFKKFGKRMPYTVPEGFFDNFEADVFAKLEDAEEAEMHIAEAAGKGRRLSFRKALRVVVATAAAIAAFIAFDFGFHERNTVTSEDVEQAFSQLNTDDQAFLLEVYQNDVFLNEQE